jgi:uncharacterized lipoprotein YddW (UPF0748 family)
VKLQLLPDKSSRAVLFLACLLPSRAAAEPPSEKSAREVRAIWITRWDYKTEADVRHAVEWCADLGLNRIFFQVRGRADAFYRSKLEPWGEELGGKDPGFDPLSVAIDEAHKRGVELDAWVNLLPAWKGSASPLDPHHVLYRHPEWFLTDNRGRRRLKSRADYTLLNPCLPEVRSYLAEVIEDIASRYPVHGIQLDYIRFLGRNKKAGEDFPYDPATLRLFKKHSGESPERSPVEWDRWRQMCVDTLLYRVSSAARRARPGCRVSVAAIQDYERARQDLFQDVVKWQGRGWIDEVYPMTYDRDESVFSLRAKTALTQGLAGKVVPGIGVHLLASAQDAASQIRRARALGAPGYCLFAFASFFPSPSHESKADADAKRLRLELRQTLLSLNRAK